MILVVVFKDTVFLTTVAQTELFCNKVSGVISIFKAGSRRG